MSDFQPGDNQDHQEIRQEGDPVSERAPLPKGLQKTIQHLKEQLIDISKRNRLINTPIGKKRGKHLDIVDERSDEVFKLLVRKKKKMQFAHTEGKKSDSKSTGMSVAPYSGPLDARYTDLKLQTSLTRNELQKRLLQLYRDSRSFLDEQGFNPLFLALGFVQWREEEDSETKRYAPLILLPVELVREGVKSNFKLGVRDEDLEPNHSFDARINNDFDLELPPWPEGDEWIPSDEYFKKVTDLVSNLEGWEVQEDVIQLGFYSSGKFLMSRDLDRAKSSELLGQLCNGFLPVPELSDEPLDQLYANPRDLGHIMGADASQTRVIAAARDGRSMVVQGPPGTGKSQTIANIIAVAVRDNQKILFVAEKRAALDVVYERLKSLGLDRLCLNMHSTKAQKKVVYDDLGETLRLGRPLVGDPSEYEELKEVRDQLNDLSSQMHAMDEVTGETPYQVIGQLTRLMAEKDLPRPSDYDAKRTATWDREQADEAREEIRRLAALTEEYGPEGSHPWRGANQKMSPMVRGRLNDMVQQLQKTLENLNSSLGQACTALGITAEGGLGFADSVLKRIRAMGARPIATDRLIRTEGVIENREDLQTLFGDIQREQEVRTELEKSVTAKAFDRDWSIEYREIAEHQASLFR